MSAADEPFPRIQATAAAQAADAVQVDGNLFARLAMDETPPPLLPQEEANAEEKEDETVEKDEEANPEDETETGEEKKPDDEEEAEPCFEVEEAELEEEPPEEVVEKEAGDNAPPLTTPEPLIEEIGETEETEKSPQSAAHDNDDPEPEQQATEAAMEEAASPDPDGAVGESGSVEQRLAGYRRLLPKPDSSQPPPLVPDQPGDEEGSVEKRRSDVDRSLASLLSSASAAQPIVGRSRAEACASILRERPTRPPITFTPPPPNIGLDFIPPGGFKCEECGNAYPMRTLLENHMERRIYPISAFCPECRREVRFYNKCRFREHERRHGVDGLLRGAKVGAFSPTELDAAVAAWLASPAARRLPDLQALLAYEKAAAEATPADVSEKLKSPLTTKTTLPMLGCSECGTEVGRPEALRRHFVYNLPTNQKQYICQDKSECSAVFFSPCSFSAHRRAHAGGSPGACPECGESVPDVAAHLPEHRNRPLVLKAWRCQKCAAFYANLPTLLLHSATAHARPVFQCRLCQAHFESSAKYQEHHQQAHPMLMASHSKVLCCPYCDKNAEGKEALVEHLKTHIAAMTPFRVFRCPLCGRLMENKAGLLSHYARAHAITILPEQLEEIPYELEEASPPRHNRKRAAPTHLPPDAGAAEEGGRAHLQCPYCPPQLLGPLPNDFLLRLHIKQKHPERAIAPLIIDPKDADGKKEILSRPLTLKFRCPKCPEALAQLGALKAHLAERHAISDPDSFVKSNPRLFPASAVSALTCRTCGELMPNSQALDLHAKTHASA